jgi:hypothetical protein
VTRFYFLSLNFCFKRIVSQDCQSWLIFLYLVTIHTGCPLSTCYGSLEELVYANIADPLRLYTTIPAECYFAIIGLALRPLLLLQPFAQPAFCLTFV